MSKIKRIIKFRGKSIKSNNWVYGDLIQEEYKTYIRTHDTNEMIEVNDHTVGQSTGLNDKKGNEVYEDDILKQYDGDEHKWVVTFDEKWHAWTYYVDGLMNCFVTSTTLNYHEIIGNRFDNRELLNK